MSGRLGNQQLEHFHMIAPAYCHDENWNDDAIALQIYSVCRSDNSTAMSGMFSVKAGTFSTPKYSAPESVQLCK